jgi:hypothetical protein
MFKMIGMEGASLLGKRGELQKYQVLPVPPKLSIIQLLARNYLGLTKKDKTEANEKTTTY